jgi:hypothetical protein
VSIEQDNAFWAHVLRAKPRVMAELLGDTSWVSHKLHGELKRKVVAEM